MLHFSKTPTASWSQSTLFEIFQFCLPLTFYAGFLAACALIGQVSVNGTLALSHWWTSELSLFCVTSLEWVTLYGSVRWIRIPNQRPDGFGSIKTSNRSQLSEDGFCPAVSRIFNRWCKSNIRGLFLPNSNIHNQLCLKSLCKSTKGAFIIKEINRGV